MIEKFAKDFAKYLNNGEEPSEDQVEDAKRRLVERALYQVDSSMAQNGAAASDEQAGGFLKGLSSHYSQDVGGGSVFDARGTDAYNNHVINSQYLDKTSSLYGLADMDHYSRAAPGYSLPFLAYADAANDRNWMGVGLSAADGLRLIQAGNNLVIGASPRDALSVGSSNWMLIQAMYASGKINADSGEFMRQVLVDATRGAVGLGDSGLPVVARGKALVRPEVGASSSDGKGSTISGVATSDADSEAGFSEKAGTLSGDPEIPPRNASQDMVRSIERQNEAAKDLARAGYDVDQLPNNKRGVANPDLSVNGELADVYSPTTDSPISVLKTVALKVDKQADVIILNLADSPLSISQMDAVISGNPVNGLKKIYIIKDKQFKVINF